MTVDPRRDTPGVLRVWRDRFDQRFIGLWAREAGIHAAERALYADPSSIASASAGPHHVTAATPNYQVNHAGSIYAFGPSSQSIVYTGVTRKSAYAADFMRLLANPGH